MAVLTCDLCDGIAETPVEQGGHVFCCHGCLQLYEVLGPDEVMKLKSRSGLNWDAVRQPPEKKPRDAANAEVCNLELEGIWCASCAVLVETVLKRSPGVVDARVDFSSSSASVSFDNGVSDIHEIEEIILRLGYGAKQIDTEISVADRDLLRRFGIAVVLSFVNMMISLPVWFGYLAAFSSPVRWGVASFLCGLSTPVVFWAGWPFLKGAMNSVRHRVPTMDLLISIGSVSAYSYSLVSFLEGGHSLYFDTASLLVTFLLLSRSLEAGTRRRASRAVTLLSRSHATSAVRLRDGSEEEVAVSDLQLGDRVVISQGDIAPADGHVVSGTCSLDESILTGESLPKSKSQGDVLYAGTACVTGRAVVGITRIGRETVLGQTTSAVKTAQELQERRRKVVQSILNVFIPVVFITGMLTFLVSLVVIHIPLSLAILRGISVLVIACPCSLSVAVPLMTAGVISRLSEDGLLLRSADCLERMRTIDTVIFDKTGTLTDGEFRVVDMVPADDRVLALAASVETSSSHPVAKAIVASAMERGLPFGLEDSRFTGTHRGVAGRAFGEDVEVEGWQPSLQLPTGLHEKALQWNEIGYTISVIKINQNCASIVALKEQVRPSSTEVITKLRHAGRRVIMLSGDSEGPCRVVAEKLGIREWAHGQLPLEKSQYVQDLQSQGGHVAFVGDGVNDAPALVHADLGIALQSGVDIAMQAGDLVLSGPSLAPIAAALEVTVRARSILTINLTWAILYNAIGVMLAVAGVASPAIAALAMAMSSAFVLGNSLRIVGFGVLRYAKSLAFISATLAFFVASAWLGL